ncbi:hypothetical protein [Mucilaginibacter aquatilis]|uniref:Uncharacterized protein n=1 Tax=Mucilaginibacter aquatilis TaxID=1517760 RepID=A0A6I4IPS1_9SPHI|nr:hypothetical protein [Mucilaginibacter aquatilis]MVN89814.1 hypothetical protein [Mucilaginibacter aquatilis]
MQIFSAPPRGGKVAKHPLRLAMKGAVDQAITNVKYKHKQHPISRLVVG